MIPGMPLSKKVKKLSNKNIAVIGAGYWGKNLIRVFYKLNVLKVICDSDKNILEKRKTEYPGVETTANFQEILKDKEIKAAAIAAPAATHYQLTKKALNAGKDVFAEKPLALNAKEGKELVNLAKKKKLILMVGHLLHYHPAIVELKKIIKKGTLGNIRYIYSNRLNFGKLRKEENVLWSFAPHDISLIINILGKPKKAVSFQKSYLQKNVADTTLSILEFKKGQAAHIFVSWLNPFKEQKFVVIGSKAMAVFDDQAEDKLIIYPHKINWKGDTPEAQKSNGIAVKLEDKEPLTEEIKHFLKCLKTRKEPLTNGQEGLDVLRILEKLSNSKL